MKYIRTKDKIEKVPNDYANKLVECPNLKIADTIEKLCDEYVAVGIPFRTFIVDLNEIKKSGLDIHSFSRACYMQYKNCAIYGAIWTDKGLQFVACMNSEGSLELL